MSSVLPFSPPKQPQRKKVGWQAKILSILHITNRPVVRVYRSFGAANQVSIQGHVLRLSPRPRTKYRQNFWINTFALLRLFLVRPYPFVTVKLHGTALEITTKTDADGFFRLDWQPAVPLVPGWHPVQIDLILPQRRRKRAPVSGIGEVYIPHPTQYGFISDIDDTFLISHSATKLKRLWVLLTQNAHSRSPFAGVVRHYQALSQAGTTADAPNPFFYVSSSEWNLYDYILEFQQQHQLPTGVLLLSQLKRFRQLWQTGQNKHFTKLDRIARILTALPNHQFILLGDDTQSDPAIYATVVAHHAPQVRCVYLRQVGKTPKPAVQTIMAEIEAKDIPCCYFVHSATALEHSKEIGLIVTN